MARLEILNPVANTLEFSVKPAPRLRGWPGVTVGLYWNMKAGGDFALDRTEQLLGEKFPGIKFKRYTGSVGWLMRHCTVEDADRIAGEVHAEHAQIFARAGWGRPEIQAAMYRAARLPFSTLMLNKERKAMAVAHPELGWLHDHPDLALPVVEDASCYDIAVVGAAAGRGAYFYGAGEPVTLPVEE